MPTHSRIQIAWLDSLSATGGIDIQHALSPTGEYYIPGIGHVDGYCYETNTVYEFHGSFWHGDPKLFDPASTNTKLNKTFGQLYSETLIRDEAIRSLGYRLIVAWESEVDKKALLAASKRLKKDISLAWISNEDLPKLQEALELYRGVKGTSFKVNIIRDMCPERVMSIARKIPLDTKQTSNIRAMNKVVDPPTSKSNKPDTGKELHKHILTDSPAPTTTDKLTQSGSLEDAKDCVVCIISKEDSRRIQKAIDYYESILTRNRENQRKKRGKVQATAVPIQLKREKPKMQCVEELSLAELMLWKPISISAKSLQTII